MNKVSGLWRDSALYRLVLGLVWAGALGACLFAWITVSGRIAENLQSTMSNAEHNLGNLTRVTQEHTLRTLRGADQVIRFIRSRYLEMGKKLDLKDLTDKGIIDAEIFNQVGVIDSKGIYILSNYPITQKIDLSDREHFIAHTERDSGELFISRPVLGRASKKWSIQLTRRINNPDGSFGGVVVVSIDPGYFTRFYGELDLGPEGLAALYGMDGFARARRVGSREEFIADATSSALFSTEMQVKASGSFVQASAVDGVERFYYFRKIPGYNLLVVTGLDMEHLLAVHKKSAFVFRTQASVATVLLLLLASLITVYLSQVRRQMVVDDQARQGLQSQTDQLHAILDLSPDGFVSFDPTHRVLYVNPAFVQFTGLQADQLVGQTESSFSAALQGQCTSHWRFPGISALRARVLARQPNSWEQIEVDYNGKRMLQVGMRFGATHAISQILYFRDVTREAEIDQMKSDFLATAAHELRTPMASIYGFSEVLLTQQITAEEQQELLGIVHNQSKAMSEILNELLDLARIEARKGKDFRFNYLCVQALIDDLVKSFKVPDGRQPPVLTMPGDEVWIMADASKLKQALRNVLSNAYKYSPAGGNVEIAVEQVAATPDSQEAVRIHVADYGIGMSYEQARRVFERFYRADSSGKVPGTGLGMSIVREIVELHKGEVSVASHLGQGTRITMNLPASVDTIPSA